MPLLLLSDLIISFRFAAPSSLHFMNSSSKTLSDHESSMVCNDVTMNTGEGLERRIQRYGVINEIMKPSDSAMLLKLM
ncbi:hypothetical protein RYX36_003808, partial [Vicia faba]